MVGHQPLVVYLCVSECICVCDIARRMMKVDSETFTSMSSQATILVCHGLSVPA